MTKRRVYDRRRLPGAVWGQEGAHSMWEVRLGGRASLATHGQQMGNRGRASKGKPLPKAEGVSSFRGCKG
jgi:hypothetical protein